MERKQKIIRASIIGIAVNIVLVTAKLAVGLLSNSIAILLDAVNNMGDALSSVVTIIGTRLAGRAPDKRHPYGYGRIEYLTSGVIAVIVLMAGATSVRESVDKILHPQAAAYTAATLAVLVASIAAKLLCGLYMRAAGRRLNAQTLAASGSDAFFDAVLSAGTLFAAVANMIWKVSLEGILGLLISLVILKAGAQMLLETLNSIIGTRTDKELAKALKEKINGYPQVRGTYDLALHNYGPMEIIGSVHVEVEDSMPAREIHRLTRQIAADVYEAFGIILTVGIYASNTGDSRGTALKERLETIVSGHPEVLQVHGFYADSEEKTASFDLVVDFKADPAAVQGRILEELGETYPDWRFVAVLDSDYSD